MNAAAAAGAARNEVSAETKLVYTPVRHVQQLAAHAHENPKLHANPKPESSRAPNAMSAHATSDAALAAAAAAMNEVLSNADLLPAILSAPCLRDAGVARAELVCVAWARAVARNEYWRHAMERRFPSALPAAAPHEQAAAAAVVVTHARARTMFSRRASAEARRLPITLRLPAPEGAVWELRRNYRFCLELRDGGDDGETARQRPRDEEGRDSATLLSATFHVAWRRASAVATVNSCRPAHDLEVHAQRGLDVARLAALAEAGEDNELRAGKTKHELQRAVKWG